MESNVTLLLVLTIEEISIVKKLLFRGEDLVLVLAHTKAREN